MTSLITDMFSSFGTAIEGLTGGIKDAFLNIIYLDPSSATPVVSPLAQFIFIMGGLSIAIGLVYGAVRLIRSKV